MVVTPVEAYVWPLFLLFSVRALGSVGRPDPFCGLFLEEVLL